MQQVEIVDFPYRSNAELLFSAIRHMPDAIWLDSGKPRSLYGRFDIITAHPEKILETVGDKTRIITTNGTSVSNDDPFLLCEQLFLSLGKVDKRYNHYPFVGGLAGYFGYDLGRYVENQPNGLPKVDNLPDMRVGSYGWALVLNHSAQKAWLFFRETCSPSLRKEVIHCLKQAPKPLSASECLDKTLLEKPFSASIHKDDYLDAISKVKNYILAGDCYQVNFAQHFSAGFGGDNWALYRHLRQILPSPYSCFYQWGDQNQAILSLSPERFLKLSMGQVETKPIKGTIRRGRTVEEDQQNAISLMNSPKNRAENLMIVDLLRNDLGKTCKPGSIRAPKLFALESFPNVHHLVSTVTGTLRDDESPLSLLRGCFPGGSITGAPKKRAMEIIEELEICRRSAYCGSMGYISATGRMDTNIAIRTLLSDGEKLHCWGGGGIVSDSNAEDEYQETLDKIRTLIEF
jgi:para-aminobenzoate synthetase component I